MAKIRTCLILLGILGAVCAQEHQSEDRWWDVCDTRPGKFGGGRLPEEANDKEAAVIKALKFDKWKKHDDEFISFEYPDHPLVKLTVNKAKKPFKVEGGVCSTVDNSYTQAYLIHVGKATYGVFLLRPAEWLDDGICFCGPMIYHAYKLRQGTLTRFSMLPGGAVKKAQVIGGGLRFMAFEWTHLACQKPIYERMVASMRLKTANPKGNKELRAELVRRYGKDATLGLITRGSPAASLIKAFGKPTQKADNGIWTWEWIGKNYPSSLTAKIKDGLVVYYPNDGIQRDYDNPVRGSLPWCEQHVKMYPTPGADDDVLDAGPKDDDGEDSEDEPNPQPTAEDKALFLSIITATLKKGPESGSSDWRDVVDIANLTTEKQIHLPQWSGHVVKNATGYWYETRYLQNSKSSALASWARRTLLAEVAVPRKDSKLDSDDLESLVDAIITSSPATWQEIASQLWTSEYSGIRRLAFLSPDKLDAITLEPWIFSALSKGVDHDDGQLAYYAMEAIPKTTIQKKTELSAAVSKLPKGSEHSEWRDKRDKALNYLNAKNSTSDE